MSPNLPGRRTERRSLRLWPVGTALGLAFLAAIAVAAGVFFAGWRLLGAQGLTPEHRLTSETLFDLVKLSFGVVAGAGALVALVVAYRRQRVDEDGALRDATRLHTERFATAVSQLGEESAAVQLGGVHGLAALADDAPTRDLRQTCIDVLCAYLRLPYTAEADLPSGDGGAWRAYLALREVRHTVIRLIRDRLRLPGGHPQTWQGHDLDFTGVVFDGGDFSRARFTDGLISFAAARFTGGAVLFDETLWSGQVDFTDVQFSGQVSFMNATFAGGEINFLRARFESACEVHFEAAQFLGGAVRFVNTHFAGGDVAFNGASFMSSEVHFDHAYFTGSIVDFRGALGPAPGGLVPSNGQPLPIDLHLPQHWYPATP